MYEDIGALMATSFLLTGLMVGLIGISNNPDTPSVNRGLDSRVSQVSEVDASTLPDRRKGNSTALSHRENSLVQGASDVEETAQHL